MAEHRVELAGVSTWYEEHGAGEPVVLLHGGLSDSRDFAAIEPELRGRFRVLMPERRGHGRTPDAAGPITYDLMADDTIAFLTDVVAGPAHLVGYSDGANVALLVALRRPDLVRRLVLVSGNFHHDGIPSGLLDLDQLGAFLVGRYAELSPDGAAHFPVVLAKVARMIAEEPTLDAADLAGVAARTLVMAGDDDLVSIEHTVALYRGIRDSELAIVPGTSHALVVEKPELCDRIILEFLTRETAPTFLPVRRARPRRADTDT